MLRFRLTHNQNIIQVNNNAWYATKQAFHYPLKNPRGRCNAIWEAGVSEKAFVGIYDN